MLSPDRIADPVLLPEAAADYDVVRRAIAHIRGNWRTQPEIADIAEAAGVSTTELHHLFRRWAGLTPKDFLQALTLDHARALATFAAARPATRAELEEMAHEFGEFKVVVVEVCLHCSWNHMIASYLLGDGVKRKPPRRQQTVEDIYG